MGMGRRVEEFVKFMSQVVQNVFRRILTSRTLSKMKGKYNSF